MIGPQTQGRLGHASRSFDPVTGPLAPSGHLLDATNPACDKTGLPQPGQPTYMADKPLLGYPPSMGGLPLAGPLTYGRLGHVLAAQGKNKESL